MFIKNIYRDYSTKQISDRQLVLICLFMFVCSFVFRFLMANFTKSYIIYGDEYLYWNNARCIVKGTVFDSDVTIIWYQLLLSIPMFLFDSVRTQITFITAMNSLLVSSVIIWIYKLGRAMKLKNNYIVLAGILILLLPNMLYATTFMTENLFLPLMAGTMYFEYRLYQAADIKDDIKYAVLLGIFLGIGATTRDIGAIVAASFISFELFFCLYRAFFSGNKEDISRREIIKRHLIREAVVIIIYVIITTVVRICIPNQNVAGEPGKSLISLFTGENALITVAYFLKCLIQNFTFWIISYNFFLIFIPIMHFEKLNKSDKIWYAITMYSALVMIFASTLLLDIKEMGIDRYQKERYTFYFIIPLILILVKILQNRKELNSRMTNKVLFCQFATVFVWLVYSFVRDVTFGSQADHNLMKFMSSYFNTYRGMVIQFDSYVLNVSELIIKAMIIIFVIGGSFVAVRKQKMFVSIYTAFLIVFFIFLNVLCQDMYYRGYHVDMQSIRKLEALDRFAKKADGNILVIMDESKLRTKMTARLDTYISDDLLFVGKHDLFNMRDASDCVDFPLNFQNIIDSTTVNKRWKNTGVVRNKKTIDYIIVMDDFVDLKNAQEIEIDGLTDYKVFKNANNTKGYVIDITGKMAERP